MKRLILLFKESWSEFGDDKAQRLGAALAYYTIFSIAPLLLIAIAIAGVIFGRSSAQQQIVGQIHTVLGPATGDAITDMLSHAPKPKSGIFAAIIGVVTLLMGAAGVFGQLKEALNTIWNVHPEKTSGILGIIKERFLSMAMVFGVGFLLLVTLVVDAAISAMSHWIAPRIAGGTGLLQGGQLAFSFVLITLLFAMIFRYLPDAEIEWGDVWLGSAVTSLLFVIGKFALGLWLGKGTVGSAYGAAGSLVVLLVWVYWSAQILFFGAEFTQVYARRHGSLAGDQSKAIAAASADRVEDRRPSNGPEPASVVVRPIAIKRGGLGKLAVGGAAGLLVGALVGGLGAAMLVVKSVRKLLPP